MKELSNDHILQVAKPDLPDENNDWQELMDGDMYKDPGQRIFELEKLIFRLQEENTRLRQALFGHHHSLPNDKNNY